MKASEFDAKFDAGTDLTPYLDVDRAWRVNHPAHVLCYVAGSSDDPDRVECLVPYRIDDGEIFFGPCKKPLREWMRSRYLNETTTNAVPPDDVYVVGFNGGNASRTRKVVWIGKLTRVMTFAFAFRVLTGPRYQRMRERLDSPLHVRPIVEGTRLVGYEHGSEMHADGDAWMMDLVKSRRSPDVLKAGRRLLVRKGVSAWTGFPRDVCLLFENVFFAMGRGRSVDDRLVSILRTVQPGRGVDRYAVFGYLANGTVDGKRGSYLSLSGEPARDMVHWIRDIPQILRVPPMDELQHGSPRSHAPRRC